MTEMKMMTVHGTAVGSILFPMGTQQPGPSQQVPPYPLGYPPIPYAHGPPLSGPAPATTPASHGSASPSEEED